jgi:hypothetical protein
MKRGLNRVPRTPGSDTNASDYSFKAPGIEDFWDWFMK